MSRVWCLLHLSSNDPLNHYCTQMSVRMDFLDGNFNEILLVNFNKFSTHIGYGFLLHTYYNGDLMMMRLWWVSYGDLF